MKAARLLSAGICWGTRVVRAFELERGGLDPGEEELEEELGAGL